MKSKESYEFKSQNGKIDEKELPESVPPDDEEVPSISFFSLFRYATTKDKIFIYFAILSAIISGCTLPINMIILAQLLQAMVDYGMGLYLELEPDGDLLLSAVQSFAIQNSILGIILVVGGYLATVLMNIPAFNQIYKIRQEYLKAAMNQDFEYFDLHQTGDFSSKMSSDVLKLEDGIGEKLTTFIYYQACFFSAIIMALIKGWELALICLASFPVTIILVGAAGLISSRLGKKESVASGKAASIAEEILGAVRTVYAFSGQVKEEERYKEHLQTVRNINIKKGFFNGLAMGFLMFCIFGTYALAFWFGFQMMINKDYDTETVVAVFFGVLMGSANFGVSSTIMEVFGMASGAGAKIFYLIDNVPSINPLLNRGVIPDKVEGNIEFKNVFFHYPSRPDVPVLKGINMTVKRGQSVALVGHSGCGKSTIVQLMSRNYDVIDGTVLLDGSDVRDLSVCWLRAQIGLVGQEPVLFNNTVRENIRYGRQDATNEEIEQAAKVANAHQFIKKLPKGYDTIVGERGTALSGGQKQRIAIARALVRDPAILLLDEATSALDTASEAKVQRALDKAAQGRTTIVIAHRLSTIRNVDQIYVFKDGVVVEIGNHNELLKLKQHYYDMVMMQTLPDIDKKDGDNSDQKLRRELSVSSDHTNEHENEIVPVDEEKEIEHEEVPFRRVIGLNSPEWKSITFASVSALLNGFCMPLLSVVFGDFIGVMSNPDTDSVLQTVRSYALIFVGIGVFSGLTSFVQVFMYGIAGEYLTERLRQLMFGKILQQEIAFFDNQSNSVGSLCAKLSGEASQVQGATGQRVGTILQAVGTFGFALVLAMFFEWRVGLVCLVFAPVIAFIMYKQGRMVSEESFGTAKTMENSTKIAIESISNIRTVASLGREPMVLKEYAIELKPALALATRSTHWRGLIFGLSRGVFNFIYSVAMFYGGILIVNQGVDYGSILKASQALLMGTSTATSAFAFAPNFQKGILAAGRIITLLNRQTKVADPDQPAVKDFNATGEASLQKVDFRYPTRPSVEVLKGLELEIERGKTIALVGASGCGKSTIIQLLERYYDPDNGIVALDSVPLTKILMVEARRGIGFVQQEPVLFDRTIAENIAYGDNSRKPAVDEIIEAAKQANIHNFITSLPLGYDTNIGSKGTQLSGGQKQRVAIARALLRRPNILLLDEATSALDTESEKVVQEALDAAKEGRTCVTIAHRLSTIRDADVICVIHAGSVAERGTHHQLMASKGLYYMLNQRGYS